MSIGIFSLLFLGLMIVLGVIQHYLGKKNLSKGKGLIIPIVYFLFRLLLSEASGGNNLGMKLLFAAVISYIYYAIFESAKKKTIVKTADIKQEEI